MIPTQNQIVRIRYTAMTGRVTEVGCGKCIVLIDSRSYECDFDELTEPIVLSIEKAVNRALKWLIEMNYLFFEDKGENGSVKIAGGAVVGTLFTLLLVWITNQ